MNFMKMKKVNMIKIKLMLVMVTLMFSIVITGNALSFADVTYGAGAVEQDETLSLEAMLIYAIQDEYLARAEYELILNHYDVARPFSNIIVAEERHISWLEPLFKTYDIELPEDNALSYVSLPEQLADIYTIGVNAEINNIEMYQLFLKQELPADIELVFTALKNASENHLAAFEKQVNRQSSETTTLNASNSTNDFGNRKGSMRLKRNR